MHMWCLQAKEFYTNIDLLELQVCMALGLFSFSLIILSMTPWLWKRLHITIQALKISHRTTTHMYGFGFSFHSIFLEYVFFLERTVKEQHDLKDMPQVLKSTIIS